MGQRMHHRMLDWPVAEVTAGNSINRVGVVVMVMCEARG